MKGHVRQRSNGKWEFSIPLENDANGKRKRSTSGGFSTEEEAKKAYVARLHELNTGKYIEPSRTTVESYFTPWLERKKNQLKYTTYRAMEGYLKNHVTPVIGHIYLSKLTIQHVQHVYDKMIDDNFSPQSIKHVHTMLKQGFNRAVKQKLIAENPALDCETPPMKRKEIEHWSIEELQQFLDFARPHRWYPAILIAAYTGARKGEILGLQWENIDFQKKMITIRYALSAVEGGKYERAKPKTNSSIRSISVPEQVMQELEGWRNTVYIDEERGLSDERLFNQPNDFVVHTYNGNYVNPYNFSKAWRRLVKQSGLKPIRFHDLRHTHATLLLQSGINMKAISARLGHSTVTMTLDTYSHVTPQMEDGITETLGNLLVLQKNK